METKLWELQSQGFLSLTSQLHSPLLEGQEKSGYTSRQFPPLTHPALNPKESCFPHKLRSSFLWQTCSAPLPPGGSFQVLLG